MAIIERSVQCDECDEIFEVEIDVDTYDGVELYGIFPECGFEDHHKVII